MNSAAFGSIEVQMLWLSVYLGIAQLVLATVFSVLERGLPYGVGARDTPPAPLGKIGARLERALKNFLETFVFFAAAVLMAQSLGKHTPMMALGAQVYFWSRVVYVPVYAFGIPFLRTLIWAASLIGIGMVMRGIWPGV